MSDQRKNFPPNRHKSSPNTPRPPQSSSHWQVLLATAIIIAAALLVYANSFSGPFIFDGVGAIAENPNIRQLWPIWDVFDAQPGQTVAGRPVLSFSLAVNYQISTLNVWSYHLLNLTIHILTGLLLFGIVRRTLLSEGLQERFGQASTSLALICSLVWLVHPLQTGSVTYIVQRAESMMGMFYLLSLYCAIRGFSSPNSRRWYAAAITACALGVGTKEVAATIPLMILLYDRIFVTRSFKETLARRWGFYVGLGCTWVLVGALAWFAPRGGSVGFDDPNLTSWVYAMTQCKIIVSHYLKLIFWPVGLTLDYGWPIAKNFTEIAPYAVVLGGLLAGTVLAIWRRPRLGFLGIWFFVILAPSSSFLPILTEIAAEHRMYLPLAAVVVAVVLGIYSLGKHLLARSVNLGQQRGKLAARLGYGLAGLVVVLLGLGSADRNDAYQSKSSIWGDAVSKQSENWRAWNGQGIAHDKLGEYDQAISAFGKAIELNPEYAKAYDRRGKAYSSKGEYKLAIDDFTEAIRLAPGFVDAYKKRATAWMSQGDYGRAILNFGEVIELNPQESWAFKERGLAYFSIRAYEGAIRDFSKAIELDPKDSWAFSKRGLAYFSKRDYEDAIRDLNKAIELNPSEAGAYSNRGAAYLSKGSHGEAIRDFSRSIELNPKDASPYNNRGYVHLLRGEYGQAKLDFDSAIELNPEYGKAYNNRGLAHRGSGAYDLAIVDFGRAIALDAGFVEAYSNRAACYRNEKEYGLAADDLGKIIELRPRDAMAHKNMGKMLMRVGRAREAVRYYRGALALRSDWPEVLNNLAWVLATHEDGAIRNGAEAVRLAKRACQLDGYRVLTSMDTLGAAYAEAGEFDRAVRMAERAAQLAIEARMRKVAEGIQGRVELYKAKRAYRDVAD